jgi:predicted transcriptional regulator
MKTSSKLPCELIIWYVLPDLRNEISRTLLDDYNFKQVEIAKVLGVTKAAVNQYLSSKRGENFFNLIKDKKTKNLLSKEIKKTASAIVKSQSTIDIELCRLCNVIKSNKIIYKVYEKYAQGVLPECLIQFEAPAKVSKPKGGKIRTLKCPSCKKEIQEEWIACPHCGEKMARNCPGCKAKVEMSWKACPFCARKLRNTKSKRTSKSRS